MQRRRLVLREGERAEEIGVERHGPDWIVTRGGVTRRVQAERLSDGRLSLIAEDGRQFCGSVHPRGPLEVEVVTGRGSRAVRMADRLRSAAQGVMGREGVSENEEIRALIPGRVMEIFVVEGDEVAAGALLLVLEAMKMQNEIRATRPGTVGRVDVAAGQRVEKNSRMLTLLSTAG